MKNHFVPTQHRNTVHRIPIEAVKQHTADMPCSYLLGTVKQHTADMQQVYPFVSAFCFVFRKRVCSALRCYLFEQTRFSF
jgi:hypothetical protein